MVKETKPSRSERCTEMFVSVFAAFTVVLMVLTVFGVFPLQPEPTAPRAAVVDGYVITVEELDATFNQLPAQLQAQYTKQQVLDQLIDKQLVLNDAQDQGVTVSDEEVQTFISAQLEQLGIDQATLASTLQQGGISVEEYEQAVREELVLRAYVQQLVDGVQNQTQQVAAFEQSIDQLREEANIEVFEPYQ